LVPEGRQTEEVYIEGLSTSLPENIQEDMLKSIPGLVNAEMMRAGYAIEYDAIQSTDLYPILATKKIPVLYTNEQINGNQGYEQVSVQGIMVVIHAYLSAQWKHPFISDRSQDYIDVLIADVVTK